MLIAVISQLIAVLIVDTEGSASDVGAYNCHYTRSHRAVEGVIYLLTTYFLCLCICIATALCCVLMKAELEVKPDKK